MSTLTTINSGDGISPSRTVINTNFTNLNSDKIETSVLDTDTTLAANSDAKVATQKAVKAYVDGVGVANASTTVRGVVELATQAQVDAGTATGETGAPLVVTPATLTSRVSSFAGDGRDGNVTISTLTTLTRDMYYNNLTVNSTLNTDGYRIYVAGTLSGNGSINHNGNNGSAGGNGVAGGAYGAGGGAGATSGAGVFKTGAGGAGGAGNPPNGNAGSAPATVNYLPLSALGGAGGNGTSDSGTGGAGGGVGTITELNQISTGSVTTFGLGVTTSALIEFLKKSGGSGGGGGGVNTGFANERSGGGGGGGASGGLIWIVCNVFSGTFSINCNGGTGGNGGGNGLSGGGGGGGGAGGHGGISVVQYVSKTWSGTYSMTGGTGGAAGSGGSGASAIAGANGTAGTSIEILIKS